MEEVESVLEFLRKNGFMEAESALREDMIEMRSSEAVVAVVDGEFDFERFLFPMLPPPPPVRVPVSGLRRSEDLAGVAAAADNCSRSSSSDEFVSLGSSSTSNVCSSEFTNPYGIGSTAGGDSKASSESLSAFDTARDCHDFDVQNDLYWYDEKDEGYFMTPCFNGSDPFFCPSEDKFVMTSEKEKSYEDLFSLNHEPEVFQSPNSSYLDKPCLFNIITSTDVVNKVFMTDDYHTDENAKPKNGVERELDSCSGYRSSATLCKCGTEAEGIYGQDPASYSGRNLKECELNDIHFKVVEEAPTKTYSSFEQKLNNSADHYFEMSRTNDLVRDFKSTSDLQSQDDRKNLQPNRSYGYDDPEDGEVVGVTHKPEVAANDEESVAADELLTNTHEEEYEVFDLRIIHRKNRTGFEENKELPIVLNTIVAGRYYVTEYLGSAAFSRVIQAHDFHTGIDVCLKIIKNDKDFFDQSLDEIKLLKFVNKHDPADERHILRLYDYFYHQEHLFIVCELLRANLYEFQKFNQDSGGESYFTLSRLQVITRQCLEALEYLHHLGIIHCDLKPENILIKSYRRCEIKIIDLGSSCFLTDNLCLYVQSRSYRAPEVILGLPYDQKIDIWSLGCILAELCSGEVLFPNDALVTILARMIGIFGPIDLELLVRGQETDKYFTSEYDLYHINEETSQIEYIILEESSLEHHLQVSDIGFIDFVRYLLQFDPQRRPTAKEALQHPWLSHSYE